jgi:pyruvate formate-lyase activating enzyme-like uncharacterized protein
MEQGAFVPRMSINLRRLAVLADPGYRLLRLHARVRRRRRATDRAPLAIADFALGLASSFVARWRGEGPVPGWLSPDEARAAEAERAKLLAALDGRVSRSAQGHKLHMGPLSPGCVICSRGGWGCSFINRLCNRACFFCKRDHEGLVGDMPPETMGYVFRSPAEHVDYVRSLGIQGVGFSGGEPLLESGRVLAHVGALRRAFGRSLYLWMYTNGDRVTREILLALRDAGLDEIRFNLAARGYDLAPLLLAREILPTVTVEIPVIPEDFVRVRDLLPELQAAAVDFLNLHQLSHFKQSFRTLAARGYRAAPDSGLTVPGSEECALALMLHASDSGLRLPINYCSCRYRELYQARGARMQRARAALRPGEEITDAGYLRAITHDGGLATIGYAEAGLWGRRPGSSYTRDHLWTFRHELATLAQLGPSAFASWRRLYLDREPAAQVLPGEARASELAAIRRFELLPDAEP